MIVAILCFVPGVISFVTPIALEQEHQVYVTRKSRDHFEPYSSGYVYKKVNNNPGTFSTFNTKENLNNDSGGSSEPSLETSGYTNEYVPSFINTRPEKMSRKLITSSPVILPLMNDLILKAKRDSNYNGFLPMKIESGSLFEQVKSAVQSSVIGNTLKLESNYNPHKDTNSDTPKKLQDSWPYYYFNPYEYEHIMRIDAEKEKAKDKRFVIDAARIIPIHEDLSDDIPNS